MRRYFSFAVLAFFICIAGSAQIADSVFARYSEEYVPEKTYLHFDKSGYAPGETIWFKAYLMAGNFPSETSKNFYADWYDESGKLLLHMTAPVLSSTARNQFAIPADYKGRAITVKAYTQWMLNFDTAFVFNKTIPVVQKNMKQLQQTAVTSVAFLPEGGSMVTGISGAVAFKAVNQAGNPVKIKGIVSDNTGKKITEFNTLHDGMGKFYVSPEKGNTYTVKWSDDFGGTGSQTLPVALEKGIVLKAVAKTENLRFTIEKRADDTETQFVHIVATVQGQRVYQARVNLTKQAATSGIIPFNEMPDGVMVVTVFNKDWQPLAERAAFVRKALPEFDADVKGRFSTAKRGRNELEINLIDTLAGTFSVAITDADVFTDSTENIFSHMLLSADLKGKVYNPAFYFKNTDDSTLNYLDLVMLTNGWRRIMWKDLTENKLPKLWFAPEPNYMRLTGKVFGATPSQLRDVGSMILFLQNRDSSKQIVQADIRPDGSLDLPELVFYDTVRVFYQFNKKNTLAERTSTKFDNGFRAELYKRLLTETNIAEVIPSDLLAKMQRYAEQQAALEKLLRGTTLEGVTVRTKKKDPLDIMDEKYTSGMFSSGDGYRFDLANDPFAVASQDVLTYLRGRVPGLQINTTSIDGATASWRGSQTAFFLNEMNSDAQQLRSIPMNDVAYIKVFRPPFFGAFGGGSGGAIAVYMKRGADIKNQPGKGLEFQIISGYTPVRQFYSPDYSKDVVDDTPDVRSTIYWNPDLLFNRQNTQIKVPFYNNDSAKKLRIVIQGMDEEGKLFYYTRLIQ